MGRGPGVRSVGKQSIQIDFRYRGLRCREFLRLEPTKANLKFAANLKARIEHEIATNTFDYARHFPKSPRAGTFDPRPPDARKAVSDHLDDYLDSLENEVERETLAHYRAYALIISKTSFGSLPLADLQARHVRDWVKTLTVGRKRIVNLLTPLRGMLKRAVTDGILPANPLSEFSIGRRTGSKAAQTPKEKLDPLTPEEVMALRSTPCGQLWTFWAWTGLRSGEVIALGWDDVADDCASIRVWRSVRDGREKTTKTPAGVRTLRLIGPARSVLLGMTRKPGEKVFPNPVTKEPYPDDWCLRRRFHLDCASAGVRRRRGPYQLRHTFASIALSSGEPLGWVSTMLGHSDTWMTIKAYARWIPSAMPEAGSRMLRHAEGSVAQETL